MGIKDYASLYGRNGYRASPLAAAIAGYTRALYTDPVSTFGNYGRYNKGLIYEPGSDLEEYWWMGFSLGLNKLQRRRRYTEFYHHGEKTIGYPAILTRGTTERPGESIGVSESTTGISEEAFGIKGLRGTILPRRDFLEDK